MSIHDCCGSARSYADVEANPFCPDFDKAAA
jgi:hypothetical protein